MQDVLVIGLGYVGLPLAIQAVRSGFRVTGLDTSEKIVAGLMAGRSHIDDVTDADVAEMLGQGFRATADEAEVAPQDVIVICVPTPLSEADGPDLSAVRAATATAGRLLRSGTLVSLESTTYPGTTEEVVRADVLSQLYGHHVDVLNVHGRVLIVAGAGEDHDLSGHEGVFPGAGILP